MTIEHAILSKYCTMQQQLLQVKYLATMLSIKPERINDIVPKMLEAINLEPISDENKQHTSHSRDIVDIRRVIPDQRSRPTTRGAIESNGWPDGRNPLTEREIQIVQLIADGNTFITAGKILHLSANTIKTHFGNVRVKLETSSQAAVVAICFRAGAIE